MHELSLCEDVLGLIQDAALQQGFSAVRRVRLEIGALSCVEAGALRFAFDEVVRGSIADGAALEILMVAGLAHCRHCVADVPVETRYDACVRCGSYPLQVVAGDQMRVKDLEVL